MMLIVDILSDGLFAAMAAMGFDAISDLPLRAYRSITILIAVGHALRFVLIAVCGINIVIGSLYAPLTVGFGALQLGKRIQTPITVLSVPALLPMTLGKYAYNMFFVQITFLQNLNSMGGQQKYIEMFSSNSIVAITVIFVLVVGVIFSILLFPKRTFSLTHKKQQALSFTASTFWNTIVQYSMATWPMQIPLVIAAVVVLYLLVKRPSHSSTIAAKSYLTFLYAWIVVAYYVIYYAERSYSILFSIHWGMLALAWIKDLLEDDMRFALRDKFKSFGIFTLLPPLMYPLASIMRGLSFSYITTPVILCMVAIYMIGLSLPFTSRVNIFIVLLLLNQAMVGVAKTWFFGIPEDFILMPMTTPALYISFREYFALDLHQSSKPQARCTNAPLILVCIGVCIALCCVFSAQIPRDI